MRVRHIGVGLAAAGMLGLAGCSNMTAQNPGGPLSPVNAVAQAEARSLMLGGTDVVAYFTQGQAVQGRREFASTVDGVSYWFASAEHQALFNQNPARYIPQYGGFCANGIAYAIPWGGSADTWRISNGKLYIFGGESSRRTFEMDRALNQQRADAYWASEVRGANSFIQRGKRLVLRVPHYKSGSELEAEYQQRLAAGTLKP